MIEIIGTDSYLHFLSNEANWIVSPRFNRMVPEIFSPFTLVPNFEFSSVNMAIRFCNEVVLKKNPTRSKKVIYSSVPNNSDGCVFPTNCCRCHNNMSLTGVGTSADSNFRSIPKPKLHPFSAWKGRKIKEGIKCTTSAMNITFSHISW